MFVARIAVIILFLSSVSGMAFERRSGQFVAEDVCEMPTAIRDRSNPGRVWSAPMQLFELLGINRPGGSFYLVRVIGAPISEDRWISGDCGRPIDADSARPVVIAAPAQELSPKESTENVLALTWQPAFCEIRPKTEECSLLNAGKLPLAEIRLSLHGLWPQPRSLEYCDVQQRAARPERWSDYPEIELSSDLWEALSQTMPGTMSDLHLHEWAKHGTCFKADGGAEEYFQDALMITRAINDSSVVGFLATQLGEEIRTEDIRRAFNTSFGAGAGARVSFVCAHDGSRKMIKEIRVSLRGEIHPGAPVSDLILSAETVPLGCEKGIVDVFGLQ
ncbi:MAG: ribonuclease T [Pseudomonadota bacterium]